MSATKRMWRMYNMSDKTHDYYQKLMRKHACRIRYILHQFDNGKLSMENLRKNLEFAALVLETAYVEETRKLCDEEDELGELDYDTVPDEVREWLTSTFGQKKAPRQKQQLTFKSAVNAIRTGIFFDKMFKAASGNPTFAHIPADCETALREINSWNFDVFYLNEVSKGNSLKYVALDLFNKYGLLSKYRIQPTVLEAFLEQLQAGYSKYDNPYHNLVHGADVCQSSHWMLSQTGLLESLSQLEVFASLFAALIHDYEHTGHTNNFHVQSGSEMALFYNDRSVLENHHVSSCFRLLQNNKLNILATLNREEYREFRNIVIEIVMATDMSTHFAQVKTMKSMLSVPEKIDKVKVLCLLVHSCDISHPTKTWNIHKIWSGKVVEEFFRQGDLEASLGLPYSPLCDRNNVQIASSQIGFIDFIVEPSMLVCAEMLVKMVEPLVQIPSEDGLIEPIESFMNPYIISSPIQPVLIGPGKKLPLTPEGKLCIPTPWLTNLQVNKSKWKEQADIDEQMKKKKTAVLQKH